MNLEKKICCLIFFNLKELGDFCFACNLTLSDFCMRGDSLGFEDCRLATHLLFMLVKSVAMVNKNILGPYSIHKWRLVG